MRLSWRITYVRVLAYALLVVQVVQAVDARRYLSPYMQSYWVVTYRHGFVRRGLTGEIIRPLGAASSSAVANAAWLVAAVTVVAVIVLMELLFRRRTPAACALGVLLACSPFVIDYAVYQRRPDLLGIPLLVLFGIGLLYARRRVAAVGLCLAFGVLTALVVLVHEAIALYALPWALVMICVVTSTRAEPRTASRRPLALIAAFAVPALIALMVVGLWGRASTTQVTRLGRDASFLERGTRPDGTPRVLAFDFLHDTPSAALDRVRAIPGDTKLGILTLGAILVALQGAWVWWWARPRLKDGLVRSGPVLSALCIISVVGGAVLLFATGVDWLRWVALVGSAWLVTCAVSILARDDGTERPDRVEVPILLPVAAIYLAALTPLDEFQKLATTIRTLTLR